MPKDNSETETAAADLKLTIEYPDMSMPEIIEAAKEVIEKAIEQGKVTGGYLDFHRTARIPVDDLLP